MEKKNISEVLGNFRHVVHLLLSHEKQDFRTD